MLGPLSYIGGKARLAARLVALLPPHKTFCEVFGGGCQLLFRKSPSDSEVEVINDKSEDIVTLFRVLQHHHEEFLRCLRYFLISRKWYEILKAANPISLTDIQRAAIFFLLQKLSWGGLVLKQNFHYSVSQKPNLNLSRLPEIIEAVHQRLARVQIECLPYQEILRRFDRPNTFFYCDPPYFGRKLYHYNFEDKDYQELANKLSNISGKCLVSLNDEPEVRAIFAGFVIKPIDIAYSAQKRAGRRYRELLIANYPIAG